MEAGLRILDRPFLKMKSYSRGLVTACVLASSIPCHAQYERLRFDHLTVENGLSNNWVQSIVKDSRGFLWFGTQDGLNRYDGSGIKVYRHDPLDPNSLPSSVAGALLEDSKKRLWIGSGWSQGGVALYDPEHDRFKTYLPNPGETAGNDVRVILEGRRGQLWLGTDNGIVRFDPEKGTRERFPLVPDSSAGVAGAVVSALFEDSDDCIWVGTNGGLFRFDRQQGRYTRWSAQSSELQPLARAEIWDFHCEPSGALWIASLDEGLFRLDVGKRRGVRYVPDPRDPRSISHTRIRRIVTAGDDTFYIGTENGGLNILDLRTRTFTHEIADPEDEASLSSNSIWSMYLDNQGILWIGTYNGGVDYVSPLGERFHWLRARRGGLSDAHVGSVMEDHLGNLWIGTDGGGLNQLHRKTGTYTYYRHDPKNAATIGSNAVFALLEDSSRTIWVGGWDSGLCRLDPVSGRGTCFRHDPNDSATIVNDNVWRILELRTGELLVVTLLGVDLFDRRTGIFTHLFRRSAGEVFFSAAEDGNGNLWLVGNYDVIHLDRRTEQMRRYRNDPNDPSSPRGGWTQAVLVDTAGNVWLGSTDGGLSCVVSNTHEMRRYTTADGLPNNAVTSMLEDNSGSLWLATNRGLSRFVEAINLPDKPTFINFDVHDGLQGNEFARNAACRGKSGEMFFGGSRGLNSFYPARIRRNPYVPPVVLTDLKLFNRSAEIGAPGSPLEKAITESSRLTLSYRHSMVTFEFAALNFIVPQKNRYAYMLEGFDRNWNEAGTQRRATYTNLPAGTFTLRVRGSNNDGVWNDEGVSLKIRVTPPFWRTTWFFACVGFAIAGTVFGFHRFRLRQHVGRERELRARITEAVADIKTLRGLLPICAWCRKVRDDSGYWSRLDEYVSEHTDAEFSHGICPECREKRYLHPAGGTAESRRHAESALGAMTNGEDQRREQEHADRKRL
jgi:two-component system sensor histidine kinase ChiS